MTEPSYFEALYRDDPDPWLLRSAPYEHRKRALTLASLPNERYGRGFEPACGPGLLTTLLAERCDELVASDPVEQAVAEARKRVVDAGHPHVSVERGSLPGDWPDGPLDLVVLSEILYFLDRDQRAAVARRCTEALVTGGHVVAVHWRHGFAEAATAPERAHDDLHDLELVPLVSHVEDDFRLEVFARE